GLRISRLRPATLRRRGACSTSLRRREGGVSSRHGESAPCTRALVTSTRRIAGWKLPCRRRRRDSSCCACILDWIRFDPTRATGRSSVAWVSTMPRFRIADRSRLIEGLSMADRKTGAPGRTRTLLNARGAPPPRALARRLRASLSRRRSTLGVLLGSQLPSGRARTSERAQRVSHANGARVAQQRASERVGEFEG